MFPTPKESAVLRRAQLSPSRTRREEEEDQRSYQRHRDLLSALPKNREWLPLRQYQDFWMWEPFLTSTLAIREHFVPRPGDILLASAPKSGTTWLKSMAFSIVHRGRHGPRDEGHPLRSANPHDCVNHLNKFYHQCKNPDLAALPSPGIFATHDPYSLLPDSVKNSSDCRIIYVAREPKDNFVSLWHFRHSLANYGETQAVSMDVAFDLFCSGISFHGPIWEHILEYWKEHLSHPDKVLFLKYEAMKAAPVESVRKVAEFLGCPFSADEEGQGVPEDIAELCSFKNLSNLTVNREGVLGNRHFPLRNNCFFRQGEVGDWANHLTPEMAKKLDEITQERLPGSGLSF